MPRGEFVNRYARRWCQDFDEVHDFAADFGQICFVCLLRGLERKVHWSSDYVDVHGSIEGSPAGAEDGANPAA